MGLNHADIKLIIFFNSLHLWPLLVWFVFFFTCLMQQRLELKWFSREFDKKWTPIFLKQTHKITIQFLFHGNHVIENWHLEWAKQHGHNHVCYVPNEDPQTLFRALLRLILMFFLSPWCMMITDRRTKRNYITCKVEVLNPEWDSLLTHKEHLELTATGKKTM